MEMIMNLDIDPESVWLFLLARASQPCQHIAKQPHAGAFVRIFELKPSVLLSHMYKPHG